MLIYIILNNIIELQANDFIKCFAISIPFVLIICSIKHSNDTRNYKVRIKNFNHEKCDNQINQLKEKLKKIEIEENSIINEIKILNNELKIVDNEIKPEFVDIK